MGLCAAKRHIIVIENIHADWFLPALLAYSIQARRDSQTLNFCSSGRSSLSIAQLKPLFLCYIDLNKLHQQIAHCRTRYGTFRT